MFYVNCRFLTQHITGVQRYAVELSLRLKQLFGEDIVFVSPSNIINDFIAQELKAIVIGNHSGHFWEQVDLPCYLRKHGNPLLLNLCNTAPIMYRNKVVAIHDVAFKVYPQTFSKTFLWAYRVLIPNIIKSSRKIVTVSEFSKRELVKYYSVPEHKIFVVPSAVSDNFHYSANMSYRECKDPYFLVVSSVNYRKNFMRVLQAFELLQNEVNNIQLYIVGDINAKSFKGIKIEKYKKNPQIKFLGRVSDFELNDYYSNAVAFVFPSLYEGFGLPPLEAQTCQCPVVCSAIEPHKEVVSDSAILCNPFDVEDIKEKMRFILYADRREYITKGLLNIKRFGFNKSASLLADILKSLD